jgi:pimeloyl-ACP methyl ester carboxylesterase
MADFVLVHGSWSGGFQWRVVADLMRKEGHSVFTPTLTGLGERSHLQSFPVNLSTHVQDIVNLFRFEEISSGILVGHGYAGMVISGVADQIPNLLERLVYIDAFIPEDSESAWDIIKSSCEESFTNNIQNLINSEGEGVGWPNPPTRSSGMPYMKGRPMPVGTVMEKLRLSNSATSQLPCTFIHCTANLDGWPFKPATDSFRKRAEERRMSVIELETVHACYETMPNEVAKILLDTLI